MTRCCVLIPYFNDGQALLETIASVEGDVDILVVDDGSRLISAREVLTHDESSLQVELLELETNVGIEEALNAGLMRLGSKYEYVARLDCGDRCLDRRMQKQMDYLDKHPGCVLVGSWVSFVSVAGDPLYVVKHPSSTLGIRRAVHINCPFTHPAVMFRSRVVHEFGLYPTNYAAAEDYALFTTIAKRCETANLPEVLVECRIDPTGISSLRRREQIWSRMRVMCSNFERRPVAVYGLVRALALLLTPRPLTVRLNIWRSKARSSSLLSRPWPWTR